MVICTGKVRNEAAVAEDGKTIFVRKEMTMVITGDHRYADAAGYLCFYKCFDGYIRPITAAGVSLLVYFYFIGLLAAFSATK